MDFFQCNFFLQENGKSKALQFLQDFPEWAHWSFSPTKNEADGTCRAGVIPPRWGVAA